MQSLLHDLPYVMPKRLRAIAGGPRSLARPTFCPNWSLCHDSAMPLLPTFCPYWPLRHDSAMPSLPTLPVLDFMPVVRNSLATNLCPYWPSCHMIASGPRYSRDQPFARDWPLCHDSAMPLLPTFCPYWPLRHDSAMPSLPTSPVLDFMPVVRDALATNLCPYWPLCHMIASGPRYSCDQPFARDWPLCHIDWWSATLSRPTLSLDT